jgi:hypothetical protein
MSTIATTGPAGSTVGRTLLVGLGAGLLAGVANVLVYLLGRALFALPFQVPMGGPGSPAGDLPLLAIIVTCVVPGLAAALLYWGLGRLTRRASVIFATVAGLFALLSLAGPLTLPIDLGTRLALAAMHLVAAPIITLGLLRYAPQR